MNAKKILILYAGADSIAAPGVRLADLADSLTGLGAQVTLRECSQNYDEILDAVAGADSVLFWP